MKAESRGDDTKPTRQRIIVLVLFALIVLAVTTLILTHDSSTPD